MVHNRQTCEIYPKPLILLDTLYDTYSTCTQSTVVQSVGANFYSIFWNKHNFLCRGVVVSSLSWGLIIKFFKMVCTKSKFAVMHFARVYSRVKSTRICTVWTCFWENERKKWINYIVAKSTPSEESSKIAIQPRGRNTYINHSSRAWGDQGLFARLFSHSTYKIRICCNACPCFVGDGKKWVIIQCVT